MVRTRRVLLFATAILLAGESLFGQNVTVQQPVMRVFGANTSVVVPDRGGTLIGSVSRAGDARNSFGFGPFLRSGSSIGTFREHAGMSAHVWIHDLDEMDRHLLEVAEQSERPVAPPALTGNAGHAYSALVARNGSASRRGPGASLASGVDRDRAGHGVEVPVTQPRTSSQVARQSDSERAAWHLRMAAAAEQRGATALARVHYRVAARHGSQRAAEMLKQTSGPALANR